MTPNPYAGDLGAREPVGVMAETPKKLMELIDQFSPEQLDQKPAPDKWSVREIMCHLADCEIVFAWRLRLNYEQHHPMLQPFDQDGWAKIYKAYTYQQARMTFDAVRMWNLAFIAALTPEDRKRPARHPERGELTLWTTVETIAGHDLHHLKALEEMPKVIGIA